MYQFFHPIATTRMTVLLLLVPVDYYFKSSFIIIVKYQWVLLGIFTLIF